MTKKNKTASQNGSHLGVTITPDGAARTVTVRKPVRRSVAVTIACAAAAAALLTAPCLAAAQAATPQAPALAAPQWHGCPVDEFCIWEGPDGTGKVATYRNGTFNAANQGLVNGGRSAWNRTSSKWCWLAIPGRTFIGPYLGPNQQLNNTAIWAAHRPDYIRCIP